MACEDESGRAARKRNRKAVAAAEESRRETRAMAADDAAASSLRPAWAREAHECVAMARSDVASRRISAAVACDDGRAEVRSVLDGLVGRIELLCILGGPRPRSSSL